MHKAIKNFSTNGNDYEIGDTIKKSDVDDRLVRGRKIEESKGKAKAKKKNVKTPPEEVTETEEVQILTEVSSDVQVEIEEIETDIEEESRKSLLGSLFGKK